MFYPFVIGFPGSSREPSPSPSGGRVGSTLPIPHAGGDIGLFFGECSSPQTDAPKQLRESESPATRPEFPLPVDDDPRPNFQIGRETRALRSDVVVVEDGPSASAAVGAATKEHRAPHRSSYLREVLSLHFKRAVESSNSISYRSSSALYPFTMPRLQFISGLALRPFNLTCVPTGRGGVGGGDETKTGAEAGRSVVFFLFFLDSLSLSCCRRVAWSRRGTVAAATAASATSALSARSFPVTDAMSF